MRFSKNLVGAKKCVQQRGLNQAHAWTSPANTAVQPKNSPGNDLKKAELQTDWLLLSWQRCFKTFMRHTLLLLLLLATYCVASTTYTYSDSSCSGSAISFSSYTDDYCFPATQTKYTCSNNVIQQCASNCGNCQTINGGGVCLKQNNTGLNVKTTCSSPVLPTTGVQGGYYLTYDWLLLKLQCVTYNYLASTRTLRALIHIPSLVNTTLA